MADAKNFTNMRSLMLGLARAMNLVSPEVERHHEQAAYLSLFVARQMGLPEDQVVLALYSALLHDIGSIMTEAPQTVAEIESNIHEVAREGSRMLRDLPGFADISSVIDYSECSWTDTVACGIAEGQTCERLGRIASIVHLSDVVSLMVGSSRPDEGPDSLRVLNRAKDIRKAVEACRGTEFCPEVVDAFLEVSAAEYVWMDLAHNPGFLTYFTGDIAPVSLQDALRLTGFMSRIIDSRSPFTAMHSAGVAASAHQLALLCGLDEECAMQVAIAGNLHDVGKLAVPREILEKPGKLTEAEFNIVKEHPYYTSLVLLNIDGFEDIRHWACNHHEKLNGHGYPFRYGPDDLDQGDRIMAVADVFSAITEVRPYRDGMDREQAARVLNDDAKAGAICPDTVALLMENYDRVDAARDQASRAAGKRYFESLA